MSSNKRNQNDNIKRVDKFDKYGKLRKVISVFKKLLLGFTALTILLIAITAGYLSHKYMPAYEKLMTSADQTIDSMNDKTFKRLGPTVIVGPDGELVREFKHAPYKYLEGDEISQDIKDAFVSIEDKSFYKHSGIDFKANLRAMKSLVSNSGEITQGASTITQQLVKNIFLTNEQSYTRKIKEILIAFKLEKKLSKDEILEYYINNIYFANGAYGIQTASEKYFSKDSSDLTTSEVAFLVAVPNNPTVFNPLTNKDNTITRRNLILEHMHDNETITQKKLTDSIAEEINLNVKESDKYEPESYEVSYIIDSATKIAMEFELFEMQNEFNSDEDRKEYNKLYQEKYQDVNARIREGGYEIESTIQADKQAELQSSLDNGLSNFNSTNSETGVYKTQGAGVTIDNQTNELVAIVGGRNQEGVDNTYNRAFLSHRQPGSVIKPITAYGIEIDNGMLSSATHDDSFVPKGPKNASRSYKGYVTAREALERSINTIPFKMVKSRGTTLPRKYMAKMDFSKIVDDDRNASIAIGGFTHGTTPLEIAGAYATIANNGKYVKPTGIKSILYNEELNVYINNKSAKTIYDDGSAYLLTDMLKGVIREEWGTGHGLDFGDMPVAGKTGTTDSAKDGWFSGYSPYYTTSVWVGNDMPTKIKGLAGATYPGEIWKDYMSKIHDGLPHKEFEIPDGTKKMYLNAHTGDVSDTPKTGYNNYEIIPAKYRIKIESAKAIKIEKARQAEEARKKAERTRILAQMTAEFNRKNEFRNTYGIEEEEEWANQETATANIDAAMKMGIYSETDYDKAVTLLDKGKTSVAKVRIPEDKTRMQNRVNEGYGILTDRKEAMFVRRAEEAARKKAAEKARAKAKEEARLKAIEDEKIRIENKKQQDIEDKAAEEKAKIEKNKQDKIDEQNRKDEKANKEANKKAEREAEIRRKAEREERRKAEEKIQKENEEEKRKEDKKAEHEHDKEVERKIREEATYKEQQDN